MNQPQPTSMADADRDELAPAGPLAAIGVALPPIEDVLEYTTDCIALLDADWRFTYLNRNARSVLSRGRDLIGAELHEIFVSEKGSEEWKLTQSAAKEKKPTKFEFFASHLKLWFEVHIHPLPSGLQIYFRDITGRRGVEAALAKREETLRLALEAVGDAAWDWDLKTGEIVLTGRYVKSMGCSTMRLDGASTTVKNFVHPDDIPGARSELTKHLAGRTTSYGREFRVRGADGEWRWNLARGRVIERDPVTGWATRMVGTATDITKFVEGGSRLQPQKQG